MNRNVFLTLRSFLCRRRASRLRPIRVHHLPLTQGHK